MYLGTGKKRNGTYILEFSKSPKKNWTQWLELSEVESVYLSDLKRAIKDAELAPNMPTKLSLLAKVNDIKTRIDSDKTLSLSFRQAAVDLF